ncbi:MAG: hypothetical protein JW885_02775 [Deltaproteobacteria bacterium]|nr:hypothetical protein [Candidatus Zymogenaceae bacterium]
MRVRDVRHIARQEQYDQYDTGEVLSVDADGRILVRKRSGLEVTVVNASGEALFAGMNVRLVKEHRDGRWSIVGRTDRRTAETVVRHG